MKPLKFYPIIKLFFPFLLGIICVLFFPKLPLIPWLVLLLLFLFLIVFSNINKVKQYFTQSNLYGLLVFALLFILGYNNTIQKTEIRSNIHFSKIEGKNIYIAKIIEPIQEKENSYKTIVKVNNVVTNKGNIKSIGKAIIYFAKDSTTTIPQIGNTILIGTNFDEIKSPLNLGAFNYKKYLANRNIYHQTYLTKGFWKTLDSSESHKIIKWANNIRSSLINYLQSANLNERELGVAAALIFGERDLIDNEINISFRNAGVMHILSVSGLHVGIIFIVATFLTKIIPNKNKYIKYFKALFVLIIIWFYAIITGLSPSIMRAATMFSFITIGNVSNQNVHTINSIITSAFLLLLLDPYLITNVGFQLSYLAVIGIVFINPIIRNIFSFKNKFLKYFWELIAVSLSAQIATSAISMFYFQQFPIYFLFANIIAVPLAAPVIYSGLATIAFSFYAPFAKIIGVVCNFLLKLLIEGVNLIELLPHSVAQVYSIKTFQLVFINLIIILFTVMIIRKNRKMIYPILISSIILAASFQTNRYKRLTQKHFYVYNQNYKSAFAYIEGKDQYVIADSALFNDFQFNEYSLKGSVSFFQTKNIKKIYLNNNFNNDTTFKIINQLDDNYFLFKDKRFAIINQSKKAPKVKSPLEVDFLILTNKCPSNIENIIANYKFNNLIIDSSVPDYKLNNWNKTLENLNKNIHNTKESGGFLVNL